MADTRNNISSIQGLRHEGKALVIKLPRRGKQAIEIPDEVILSLMESVSKLELDGEGVVVPEDEDPNSPRIFEKKHQATNFGRKLKAKIKDKDPAFLNGLSQSETPIGDERDEKGRPLGPFVLAFSKK